ncbi:MAG: glycosyltransferase [Sulfitobacter sp.]
MQSKVQVKALIRFSYLSEGGFAISNMAHGDLEKYLYDPERLEKRFLLFEKLTLPSLIRQTDSNFKLGILIASSFPPESLLRLKELVAEYDNFKVIQLPTMIHIRAIYQAYDLLETAPDTTHIASFRLDDDDAVHKDIIACTRDHAETLVRVGKNKTNPFIISFNRGFYFRTKTDKTDSYLGEFYEKTPVAAGMTLVSPIGNRCNVFRRNHRKANQFFNCYSDMSRPMFIRTFHGENDSTVMPTGREGDLSPEEVKEILLDGFGQRMENLETFFGV